MAKLIDWLQSGGKPLNDQLNAYFTQYNPDHSPLEQALTPEKAAILANAIGNFNANRRSPGMAEAAIPGIEPTEIPRLDPLKFGMPVGMGSWQNIPADKLRAWYDAKTQPTTEKAKWLSEQERPAIIKYVFNTPELKGRSPDEFTTLKQAQDEAKSIRSKKPVKPDSLFKLKKEEEDYKRSKAQRILKEEEAGYNSDSSSGTVAGGGVAPTGGVKVIGGKKFVRINGNWVQQ